MKISIVTTSLNSDKSIGHTLSSVYEQTYKNIEHILVDGGSTDSTLKILKQHKVKKKIIIAKNSSIYEAINIGIKNSAGDYVLILNSDDILDNKNVVKKIVKIIKKNKEKIFLGNVSYFNNYLFDKITRYYTAKNFKKWMFYFGLMPPHPGAFVSSKLAKKIPYNSKYKIAADYDFFLRVLKIKNEPFKIIDHTITRMRTGGISGKNLMAHFTSSSEIYDSLKLNRQFPSNILINLRYLQKLKQFLFLRKNKIKFTTNKKYISTINYHFKVLKKVSSIDFKKNFVLSALNLAFIGSYVNNQVKLYENLIHWPDGVFIKNINIPVKKIPGREVLENLKLPKNIRRIIVLGNLPNISKKYLENKYKRIIINYSLPYGNIKKITNKFKIKITKKDLIFITLPTPKQEQLAEFLISKNKNFKIICIGGSINIVSGLEKEVPVYLYSFEFLWRLRYETLRRISRLISTFLSYIKGKYIYKKLDNLNIKIVN